MHATKSNPPLFAALLFGIVCVVAFVPISAQPTPTGPLLLDKRGAADAPIRRMLRVTRRVYCGAEPVGEEAFQFLARLGVKTLVCVDGSRPNGELAKRFGMRYVHIPIGYDRIEASDAKAMVRVLREQAGPVFVHCHHGRQRGPAMAAIAAIEDGVPTAKEAIQVLQVAGTSNSYKGLWRDVASFKRPALDARLPRLCESEDVDQMVRIMADLDRVWDRLKSPPNQANTKVRNSSADQQRFVQLVRQAKNAAQFRSSDFGEQLDTLKAGLHSLTAASKASDADRFRNAAEKMQETCNRCHQKHRDR